MTVKTENQKFQTHSQAIFPAAPKCHKALTSSLCWDSSADHTPNYSVPLKHLMPGRRMGGGLPHLGREPMQRRWLLIFLGFKRYETSWRHKSEPLGRLSDNQRHGILHSDAHEGSVELLPTCAKRAAAIPKQRDYRGNQEQLD
jgi:hypothetical protein